MKKKIKSINDGVNAVTGDFLTNRLIPQGMVQAVGPIVFLDHVYPIALNKDSLIAPTGELAHPHRGIATLTYVFSGSLAHYDSYGNYDVVGPGGLQWMKSGTGIVHEELPGITKEHGEIFHSVQFWIILPFAVKSEEPEYLALQSKDIIELPLPKNAGVIRILLGNFGSSESPVKTFGKQFIYHIKLNPKSTFELEGKEELEYALFVPANEVSVNEAVVGRSKMVIFEKKGDKIILGNSDIFVADIIMFGGEPNTETVIVEGPFAANNYLEISEAYKDFFDGKYRTINYIRD